MTAPFTDQEVAEYLKDEWEQESEWLKKVCNGDTMHFPRDIIAAKRKKLRIIEYITKTMGFDG